MKSPTTLFTLRRLRSIWNRALFTLAMLASVPRFGSSGSTADAQPEKGSTRLLIPSAVRRLSESLPPERDIPELAALAEAYASLPSTLRYHPTLRQGTLVHVAVEERGLGAGDRVIVMIHGGLSDHQAWRYVAGELGKEFDLWLVELPGCGRSDKPHPESLGPDGYSPTAMADRVLQALQKCLDSRPKPPRLVLAAHSLGGMVALRMMGDPELRQRHAAVLQQIEGMVLLAPCDVAVHQEIPTFRDIVNLRGSTVAIGRTLGIVTRTGYAIRNPKLKCTSRS